MSTWSSIDAIAVSILRCELAVTRTRADATRLAVSKVPNRVVMIGTREPRPDTSDSIEGCSSRPPLRMTQDNDRKAFGRMGAQHCEHHIGAVAGVTTATPSVSRSTTCSAVMPATRTSIASRASSAGSPRRSVPCAAFQLGHQRRDQEQLLVGQHVGLGFEAFQRV